MILKKNLGQNILINKNKIEEIIKLINLNINSNVIEVGPGTGALTDYISKIINNFKIIEIDENMIKILKQKKYKNTEIIHSDILKINLSDLFLGEKKIFISNLPYYISSKIIFRAINDNNITQISIMIQKEVSERILASPKTKQFGRLTVSIGTFFEIKGKINVSSNCFKPTPKIDSVFINLVRRKNNIIKTNEMNNYFLFIKKCFANKRKTLLNSLKINNFEYLDEIKNYLNLKKLNLKIRAEEISIEDYVNI